MAYIVMAYIVRADIVVAYIVMAYMIMAYISMACMFRRVEIVPLGIFLCIHTVMADVFMA